MAQPRILTPEQFEDLRRQAEVQLAQPGGFLSKLGSAAPPIPLAELLGGYGPTIDMATVKWVPCAVCGDEFFFDPHDRGRRGRYCSDACKQLAYRTRHPLLPPAPKAAPKPLSCAACGKHYAPPAVGRPGRFCGASCKMAAYRRRKAGLPERMSRRGDTRRAGEHRK